MSDPLTQAFGAMADPTRRALLDELQERNGQTLFELCTRLISRHGLSSSRLARISSATTRRSSGWRMLSMNPGRPTHSGAAYPVIASACGLIQTVCGRGSKMFVYVASGRW